LKTWHTYSGQVKWVNIRWFAHVQHRPPDAQVRKSDHWEEGEDDENWSATEAWLSFAEKDVLTKLQNYSAVGNSQ